MRKEQQWQDTILRAARLLGWTCYHTYDARKSAPGFPDLVLVRPPRLLFVELKSMTGHFSREQKHWLTMLSQVPGVEVYTWRPDAWRQVEGVLAR